MKTTSIMIASIMASAATGATAGDLKPAAGHAINLGNVHGAAYYTVEDEGLRLVATVADGEVGHPVRFVSTLSDGQAMTIAIPGSSSQRGEELTFRRIGDHVVVESGSDLRAALTD